MKALKLGSLIAAVFLSGSFNLSLADRITPTMMVENTDALGVKSGSRLKINLNRGWLFSRTDTVGVLDKDFDDTAWEKVNLPHDFLISQPWVEPGRDERPDMNNPAANVKSRLSARAFKEPVTGWYRKTFYAPGEWKDKIILLDFEGIMLVGDVWVNGVKAGSTDYGYLGFETDITKLLNWDGPNVIAVRADTGRPDNSRWYTGGGLYRDVNIVLMNPAMHFTRHPFRITTPEVSSDKASVVLQAEIFNSSRKSGKMYVAARINGPQGTLVYCDTLELAFKSRQKTKEYRLDSLVIENPSLWDTESPSLYTATFTLLDKDGKPVDELSQRFGIRKIEYSPEFGLKLNGRKTLLKGIANHHTLGALGAAAYPRAMEKRLRMLKAFGFNHVRTSHNPYSESFLDLCDELGILVVDELYDKWLKQYCGGRKDWDAQWQKDVPEWVKRDRNHPSVIMWSLGNELQLLWNISYADWGVTPYRLQKTLLNRYDTGRPVTVAMHPRGRSETTDSIPAPLALVTDIASYNYRYMYFPGDSRRFPHMIFYQSEANTSNMGPNFFDMDLDRVVGLAYWGMIDYLGESNGWPAKGWSQGVFDISLQPKPSAWFLRSFFKADEPLVHIAVVEDTESTMWNDEKMGGQRLTENWNQKDGQVLSLYTYTNADEVELLVNGRSLGRRQNDTTDSRKRNSIRWDSITWEPGKVEAIAYHKGIKKPVAKHTLETTGKAKSLRVTSDNPEWKADGIDLQHIVVEAVDSRGRKVLGEDAEVSFAVEGPAEIVGVVNGDICSEESMTGNQRRLYNGTCSVILRSGDKSGDVVLVISAPGFKTRKLRMKTSL